LFEFVDELPFPLNASYSTRIVSGLSMVAIILSGLWLKKIIAQYLRSPDTKMNPINSLIWMDQLNSICFGTFNLTFGAFAFLLHSPIRDVLGESFCDWIPLLGCLSNIGSVIWSCLLAVYRIVYIKAQNWVNYKAKQKRLLIIFLAFGLILQFSTSCFVFVMDDETVMAKICSHHTEEDIEIMRNYKVG
jgi:hypothetical protein